MSQYTLHHGNCLDILPTLEAQSVDAVIADPPYGTTACKWDSVIPFEPMWRELKRVIKPRGAIVLFGSQPFTSALVMSNPKWFKYCWVWDKVKPNGMGYAKHQPMRVTEDIIVFSSDATTYNPQLIKRARPRTYRNYSHSQVNSITLGAMESNLVTDFLYPKNLLTVSNADQRDRLHPTQKPLTLLEYLVKTYTNAGDTVLDFTMGSGTTGAACGNMGRKFIGIEKEETYFNIARDRIARAYDPLAEMVA
jgi:DNA modification methylase